MKMVLKVSCIVLSVLIVLVSARVAYLWATYIDKTVLVGEGYGFRIGSTRDEVFKRAAEIYKNDKVFILYPLDERGFGPHKDIGFDSEEYELVKDRDVWKFYFTEGYFDELELTFEGDQLVKIYRHRRTFELP